MGDEASSEELAKQKHGATFVVGGLGQGLEVADEKNITGKGTKDKRRVLLPIRSDKALVVVQEKKT